jgi:hypothetical protein
MEKNNFTPDNEDDSYDYISHSSLDRSFESSENSESEKFGEFEQFNDNYNSLWEVYKHNEDDIEYVGKDSVDNDYDQPSIDIEGSPSSYFKLIITDELLTYIVDKSDIYQKAVLEKMKQEEKLKPYSRIKCWKKPSVDELNKYLALTLWMCIHSNKDFKSK